MSIKEKIAKKSTMEKGGVGSPGSIGVDTDINDRFSIMKSDAAKKWLAKRQKARGGQGVNGAKYRIQASTREGNRPGSVYKADGYVRTIYDLIDLHYNFVPEAMGKTSGVSKADDPLLTDTPGVHNEVYGSDVFVLLNTEQNVFGLLETRPWNKSGERIIDAYGASAASGGVDENAAIPETVKPTFDTYEMDPKTVVHSFDVSQVEQLLAATEDDAIADDPFAMLRQFFGEGLPDQQTGGGEHPKHINEMLCQDAIDNSNSPLNLLSIDRAIADEAEATANGGSGEYDVYGFDRTNGEFESNVIMDNNGQVFHLDLLDDAMRQVKENSDKNPQQNPEDFVFVTNHDTYQRIENEMGGKERIDTVRTQMGVNGIQTEPGNDVGVGVASYKDIPIVESVDIPKDDIGRVYLLDTTAIWCKMLLPTQFYSTGTEVGDGPFPIGRLGNEGAYVTIGEVCLKNPLTQAKIRDLE
jgi:hypothetical protein